MTGRGGCRGQKLHLRLPAALSLCGGDKTSGARHHPPIARARPTSFPATAPHHSPATAADRPGLGEQSGAASIHNRGTRKFGDLRNATFLWPIAHKTVPWLQLAGPSALDQPYASLFGWPSGSSGRDHNQANGGVFHTAGANAALKAG